MLAALGMRILVSLTLLTAGCDLGIDLDLSSEGTSVTATARGDGTTEVSICAGPRELLSCHDGERFSVAMGGVVIEDDAIGHQLFGGRIASFADDRTGTTIVVTRDRDGAEMSVELPAPFSLSSPPADAVVSRRDGITLRWSGSADEVTWTANSNCGDVWASRSGDAGGSAKTLRGDDLPAVTGAECELELIVAHRRNGRVGRGFPDGSLIHAVQERSVHVRLVP